MNFREKLFTRTALSGLCTRLRAEGRRIVFTNGCFDILHIGHISLLHEARAQGDFLIVGVNSDASVQRLKGPTRPINPQDARAAVLGALADVDAVCIFEEDTPIPLLEAVRPDIHVKGGDYEADDLPEAATVRSGGGEIVIVPLQQGFSTTGTLEKLAAAEERTACTLIIPARFGSTRFPGKPLAELGGRTVIEHVVEAGLRSRVERPVLVATDDERIAAVVRENFASADADVVMTSPACHTGTDRIAEAVRQRVNLEEPGRRILINVQGDEPFIDPAHIDALMDAMSADTSLQMGTLATPIRDAAQNGNPNIVKVVMNGSGRALYFSRCTIPYDRENVGVVHLRHMGIYAYEANWLLRMAGLPPSPLEEIEKLEQLRALEHGVDIRVVTVENVVPIAIDTPEDLEQASQYWLETHGN